MPLKPECGVTKISLDNARYLISEHGIPETVQLVNEGKGTSEHVVCVEWSDEFDTKFTGFSWGYCGEGPHGLAAFFRMIGLRRLTPEDIFSLPQNEHGVILSFSRTAWEIEYASENLSKTKTPITADRPVALDDPGGTDNVGR